MFHEVRSSQVFELSLLPLAFGPSLTVASRLLHPYITEDETRRLMVKQFSTSWNIQKDSELHREEKREEEDRGDQEKRGSQRGGSNQASNQFSKCSAQPRTPRETHRGILRREEGGGR